MVLGRTQRSEHAPSSFQEVAILAVGWLPLIVLQATVDEQVPINPAGG